VVSGLPSKRDVILFDKIGVVPLNESFGIESLPPSKDVEWLIERGVIFDVGFAPGALTRPFSLEAKSDLTSSLAEMVIASILSVVHKDVREDPLQLLAKDKIVEWLEPLRSLETYEIYLQDIADNALCRLAPLLEASKTLPRERVNALARTRNMQARDYFSRAVASLTRDTSNSEATAILNAPLAAPIASDSPHTLLSIVLEALPHPSNDTPWERIIEFRSDDGVRRSLRRLRHWLNKTARDPSSLRYADDELNDLLDRYEEYMRLQKLKIQRSKFETIVTASADVLENLATLRVGVAARAAFSLARQDIALLEAELAAPGREVAFIAKARDTFGE